jgi:protein AroM
VILGVVTIGQAPRPDLVAAFGREAPHATVVVAGALDGLPRAAIDALAAQAAAHDVPLLVRLADGSTAEVPRATLAPCVAACAAALAAAGAYAVVVACAGDFPAVPCPVPLLLPGRIVPAVVRALGHGPRIGVITPVAGQVAAATAKWRADGFDPVVAAAAPGQATALDRAAVAMQAAAPDLVVLDCMGHDDADAARFAAHCGRPVLAAQSLTARVAGALRAPPA